MKKALITGITGQDGSYLSEFLLKKGYEVYGLVRRTSNDPFARFDYPNIKIHKIDGNLRDLHTIRSAMEEVMPDEVYNLAAQSHVGVSFNCAEETEDINSGIAREKNLKAWKRQWKIDLIEKNNPDWKDLYSQIID